MTNNKLISLLRDKCQERLSEAERTYQLEDDRIKSEVAKGKVEIYSSLIDDLNSILYLMTH